MSSVTICHESEGASDRVKKKSKMLNANATVKVTPPNLLYNGFKSSPAASAKQSAESESQESVTKSDQGPILQNILCNN